MSKDDEKRRDEILRNLLNTPPKPHSDKDPKDKDKSKGKEKPAK